MSDYKQTQETSFYDVEKHPFIDNSDHDPQQPSAIQVKPQQRCGAFKTLLYLSIAAMSVYALLRSSGHVQKTGKRLMRGCMGKPRIGHAGARPMSSTGGLPSHFDLPSGDKIPSVGLGVWQLSPEEATNSVSVALTAGYKHIDGAWVYKNEEGVGASLKKSGVSRSDVWLTSKLWNTFHDPEDVEKALDTTLKSLDTDYLDLYLIHWPIAFKDGSTNPPTIDDDLSADPYPTWKKLEEMVDKGKIRNIGISNFNIRRMENLTANPLKHRPAVNQVELNFWNPQPDLVKWAQENQILLEAYSPLGSPKLVKETLENPVVKSTAVAMGITPAQVIISWHVQRGYVVLPRSSKAERVAENLEISKIPAPLFAALEAAALAHKPKRAVNPSKGWGLDYDVFDDTPL